jgi:pimeloyl-ACP methyl ester carboxylesterase
MSQSGEHTSFVRSGNAELAVTSWGTGGSPVVALHPGVGDLRIWRWCAPAWAEAGYRVVAYDRRGFGTTRYRTEPHDDLADLRAVTAASDARPAVIVGNSRGGGLALDLALAQPDHVTALVLIAPSPSGYPDEDWPLTVAEAELDRRIEAAEAAGDLETVNRLEVHYWLDGTEQPEGRVSGPPRDLMLDMNGRALHSDPMGDSEERPPAWPLLGGVTVPTLVLVGEHDLTGIRQIGDRLVERLPHARLAEIEGTAHCPSLDQPELLNAHVLEFLASLGV